MMGKIVEMRRTIFLLICLYLDRIDTNFIKWGIKMLTKKIYIILQHYWIKKIYTECKIVEIRRYINFNLISIVR